MGFWGYKAGLDLLLWSHMPVEPREGEPRQPTKAF